MDTYITFKLEMPVSSLGILPVRRLSLRRLRSMNENLIILINSKVMDIVVNSQTHKNTRDFSFPSVGGILPVILLL
ncbi:hypothetical protein Hanom_Chr06g00501891 [Helianthus anomalus]